MTGTLEPSASQQISESTMHQTQVREHGRGFGTKCSSSGCRRRYHWQAVHTRAKSWVAGQFGDLFTLSVTAHPHPSAAADIQSGKIALLSGHKGVDQSFSAREMQNLRILGHKIPRPTFPREMGSSLFSHLFTLDETHLAISVPAIVRNYIRMTEWCQPRVWREGIAQRVHILYCPFKDSGSKSSCLVWCLEPEFLNQQNMYT